MSTRSGIDHRIDKVENREPGPWGGAPITQRRLFNVATLAMVNPLARTVWAVVAHAKAYRKYQCQASLISGLTDNFTFTEGGC